jgi:FixJ family two-component response regulator
MVLSQSEKTDFFRDSIRLGVIDFVERPFQSLQILDSTKRAAEIGFSTRKLLTDLSEAAPNSFQKFNELAFFRYLMNQLPLTFGK